MNKVLGLVAVLAVVTLAVRENMWRRECHRCILTAATGGWYARENGQSRDVMWDELRIHFRMDADL